MVSEGGCSTRADATLETLTVPRQSNLEGGGGAELLLIDLLKDFSELTTLLRLTIRKRAWLDAYLVSAGMNQIIEDYLFTDGYLLFRTAPHLANIQWPLGTLAASTVRRIDRVYVKQRDLHPRMRQLARWQVKLSSLVEKLAGVVILDSVSPAIEQQLPGAVEMLSESVENFPRPLLRAVIRLPSCFRSFDQRPADLEQLVRRLADRVPASSTPIAVVGVRTSGSYLGPLIGALLQKHGYHGVQVVTMRPGFPLPGGQRSALRALTRRGGLVLLTDDPPVSGEAVAEAADELRSCGVSAQSIVLLLQLFTQKEGLPHRLTSYPSVLLPWDEWSIHEQMKPRAVQRALACCLNSALSVEAVERLPLTYPPRGHAQGLYRVRVTDRGGQAHERQIHVSGAGLGYFGRHAVAIGEKLSDLVPRVYGYYSGLLYRDWLPDDDRLSLSQLEDHDESLRSVVEYVKKRRMALQVEEDKSLRQFGRLPTWEVASNILSRAFGRAWFLARVPLVDPLVKRILKVKRPSVVDGSMASSHWFAASEPGQGLLKVDFDRRAFSNLNLYCYDSAFDLASLAVDLDIAGLALGLTEEVPERLRKACEAAAGERVSPERWLFHELVHVWDLAREQHSDVEVGRAGARALQRYFGEVFFKDVAVGSEGPVCGLDVDGVLETEPLGFPALTRTSALTLRSLLQHGYRPILVTGRSLAEVQDRCSSYKLAGGVAEYGAVVYNHHTRSVRQTITDRDHEALERLRDAVQRVEGVFLDQNYSHAVRAYRTDADGRRRGLPGDIVRRLLVEDGLQDQVRPITGDSQTDFVISGITKATGVRMLTADMGVENAGLPDKPLALAVGDTLTDLPFLSLAQLAAVPAHVDNRVRRANVTVLRRTYQAGLAQAVALLLGHFPGHCAVCELRCSSNSRLLLSIIGAQEQGLRSMLTSVLSLAVRNLKP